MNIEDNIPQPKFPRKRLHYPFKDMKVSQSFFVPNIEASSSRVRNAIWQHNKTTGEVFKSKSVSKDGVRGVRVWRIS